MKIENINYVERKINELKKLNDFESMIKSEKFSASYIKLNEDCERYVQIELDKYEGLSQEISKLIQAEQEKIYKELESA